MIDIKARAEALGKTDLEMREEMAVALGRIGRTLTELLIDLQKLSDEIRSSTGKVKEDRLRSYAEFRKRAKLYYWYLMVQREAVGLRNHEILPQLYPIPPAVKQASL
jgi:hypothetical protein